ncbi:hypothetical protein [Botrimarina sp.]|uniref:hypothetical protein n=1 Tax=Botrimarina sp. TaxID=2795802 RepID=UPI0032F02502
MTQITLNDETATLLTAAASAAGLSVDDYLRSKLANEPCVKRPTGNQQIIGCMSEHAEALDEAVDFAMRLREAPSR